MFALYASSWSSTLEDQIDERDLQHRLALREARIATASSLRAEPQSPRAGLIERIRTSVGLAPAQPECLACAA
jgi:hypothetical protein